jgi:hypothetical protein
MIAVGVDGKNQLRNFIPLLPCHIAAQFCMA